MKQKTYRTQFLIKNYKIVTIFLKKRSFQIFRLNVKIVFYESQNFQNILHKPPKSYHTMILNTKNGIYNEVWHSWPYSTQNDKPWNIMLRVSFLAWLMPLTFDTILNGLRAFNAENLGSVGQRTAKLLAIKLWEWFDPGRSRTRADCFEWGRRGQAADFFLRPPTLTAINF